MTTMHLCIAQADPWQPYHHPHGKKPPKHPIPEPMTYLGITLALLIVLAARWGRKAQ